MSQHQFNAAVPPFSPTANSNINLAAQYGAPTSPSSSSSTSANFVPQSRPNPAAIRPISSNSNHLPHPNQSPAAAAAAVASSVSSPFYGQPPQQNLPKFVAPPATISSYASQPQSQSQQYPPQIQYQQPQSQHNNNPQPQPPQYRSAPVSQLPPQHLPQQQLQQQQQQQPQSPQSPMMANHNYHSQHLQQQPPQLQPPLQQQQHQQQQPQYQQQQLQQPQQHPQYSQQQQRLLLQQQQQQQQQQHSNQYQTTNSQLDQLSNKMNSMSVTNQGWSTMWQNETINLMAEKEIRTKAIERELQRKQQAAQAAAADPNGAAARRDFACDTDVMRCTLKKMPDTASLLQKCRLPLGLILHPFKTDPNIPLIQDTPIVRCRTCRTYINPYVRLLDQKRWQCNLCQRVNEVPDEFVYDFQRQRQIDIMTRPELNYGSIEYVASVEYMVRPPQPATYLFVFECTASAVQSGYIRRFANALLDSLNGIPGDARTLIGFLAFDSKLHFFNLNEERPVHQIMSDITDIFIPHTDSVLVNLKTHRKRVENFLRNILPTCPFDSDCAENVADHDAALGPALQVAFKIIASSGGRITLIQTSLPAAGSKADGSILSNREDPNQRTANSSNSTAALTPLLNPGTDFFKRLALECSEQQVTVDLFNLAASYSDLATVGGISRFSGGSIFYYGGGGTPSSANTVSAMLTRFEADMRHYLTRPIGFEAVMRLRATRGISIHTFHGNFFVRSTDLMALPNVNPDSSYAIQMTISEDLKEFNQVCLQAALLYTASNGERRIRVHTIALPVAGIMADVLAGADQEAIVALLAKMAVDRSMTSNIQDAREALINSNVDIINTYRAINSNQMGLLTSPSTKLLPLYTLALMKHTAFRLGISTRIDDRVFAMLQMKSLPTKWLLLYIYPNLYPIHYQFDPIANPPLPVQLTFANIDRNGVYLLDTYDHLFIWICKSVHPQFLADIFNVTQWSQIPDEGEQISGPAAASIIPGSQSAAAQSLGFYNRNSNIHHHASASSPPTNAMMNGHYDPTSKLNRHNDSIATGSTEDYSEDCTGNTTTTSITSADQSPISESGDNRRLNGGGGGGEDQSFSSSTSSSSSSGGEETKSISSQISKNRKTKKVNEKNAARNARSPTVTLPVLENATSQRVHTFISALLADRPFKPQFHIIREDSRLRYSFLQYMFDDRNESAFSYYEFLQHIQQILEK